MAAQQEKIAQRRAKSSYFTVVVSLTLVLFMLGLVGLLILSTQRLSAHFKESLGLSIILKENVKEVEAMRLQKKLDATPYIKTTEHVDKEEAAEQLQKELGEDFISFLGYNPLLSSIDVYLTADYANTDSIAWIEKDLMQNSLVKEIFYQKDLISVVNEKVETISLFILFFSGLLLLIAIALINNSIRLSIYAKRFLIRTMQLVGATQGFIRRPFVWRGIFHGIIASILAIGLLVGFIYTVHRFIPELIVLQDLQLFASLFGIVVFLGMFISWICTAFAVRKYLRIKSENLY